MGNPWTERLHRACCPLETDSLSPGGQTRRRNDIALAEHQFDPIQLRLGVLQVARGVCDYDPVQRKLLCDGFGAEESIGGNLTTQLGYFSHTFLNPPRDTVNDQRFAQIKIREGE